MAAPTKPSAGKTPAEKISAKLKRVAAVYDGRGGRAASASRTKPTPDDLYLAELYTARRRRLDPMFEPTGGLRVEMIALRRLLDLRKVGQGLWPAYMDFAFEAFPAITKGRCAWPPAKNAAAASMVESYVAELGVRKLNTKRAARMLRAAGFDDVPLASVITVVRRAAMEGVSATKGLEAPNPRTIEAVAWLASRLHEVGYDDGGEG